MSLTMLDTNTVSHLVRQHPAVTRHLVAASITSLCISAITEGELHFGLAKRPAATRLRSAVREFLRRVDVLPWDSRVAERYGAVRVVMENKGRILAPLDLQIAAHALSLGAVLVTNDRSFNQVAGLRIEDWTT
jgi:tRNA(fMet)-specific endonuclease VapC